MRKCTLKDIEWLGDVTEFWTVNKDGEPSIYIQRTDDADFREYHCSGCDDYFKTWEKVKEHLA